MLQEVDIATLEWGKPPVPLLPQTLRAAWAGQALPTWVARDLSLPEGATARQLTGDFGCIAAPRTAYAILCVRRPTRG